MKNIRKSKYYTHQKARYIILSIVVFLSGPTSSLTQENRSNGFQKTLSTSDYQLPYFGKGKIIPSKQSEGISFQIDDGAFTAEILAARDGVVSVLNRTRKEGGIVELKHMNGEISRYSHLGAIAFSLQVGDTLTTGSLIGFQGKPSSDEQSNFLHFTIQDKNGRCDTMQLQIVRQLNAAKEVKIIKSSYSIIELSTGKCIDIPNGSGLNGKKLILYARNEGPNQHWLLKQEGDYYKIISEYNGKAISVSMDESSKTALIVQDDIKETDNQLWVMKELGDSRAFFSKLNSQALLPAQGDTLMQLKQIDNLSAGVWTMKPAEENFSVKETLTPEEMKADLDNFVKTLTDSHPNIYAYTIKDKFNIEISNLRQSFNQTLPYRKFVSKMDRLNKHFDGHTKIYVTDNAAHTRSYVIGGGLFFPHRVRIENGKLFLYISKNDSSQTEILSINQMPATEIISHLSEITNFEKQKMNDWYLQSSFGLLLHCILNIQGPWFEYESCSHQSGIKTNAIEMGTTVQNALSEISRYYDRKQEFEYSPFEEESIALIEYNTCPMTEKGTKDLEAFLAASFDDIKQKGIRNLFIDISRNGGGGGDEVNSLLYNKLNHQAHNWQSVMYRKIPGKLDLDTMIVPQCTNTITNGFDGNVYLIQSNYTYSAAVGVSAWFKFSGRGKILGEETGGTTAAYVYAPTYQLPNSKITYQVSNTLWKFPFGARKDQGILPDVRVKIDYSKPHFELSDLKAFLAKTN